MKPKPILKSVVRTITWLLIITIVIGFTCLGTTLDLIGIDIVSAGIDWGAYIFGSIFILTGIVYAMRRYFLRMNDNRASFIP